MSQLADLHTHTIFSDGVLTPRQLMEKAVAKGISALSITDHDTVDGCVDARLHLPDFNIDFIDGVEISCFEEQKEYHILGYAMDITDKELVFHLEEFKKARYKRAEIMQYKLNSLGININFNDILEKAGKAPITRPHIAEVLLEAGYVSSMKEAFNKFIGDNGPAYQAKATFPVEKAIKIINKAGGMAVLAHPANYVDSSKLYKMIESGLDGIEVIHPMHNERLRRHYHKIAGQYWLIETGGSDFHGSRDFDEKNFGLEGVHPSVLDSIRYHTSMR